ncbi:MAG: hypothetical protein J6I42_04220 [Clostridia bacterium]|nr:hypothetical protein [Clostridia bacterium]
MNPDSFRGFPEKNDPWNAFIDTYCTYPTRDDLTPVQRIAVLCFNYDAEMNSGGYVSYHDMYPDVAPDELAAALRTVYGDAMAENYLHSVAHGANDDYVETDMAFYKSEPSLTDAIQAYIKKNLSEFFPEHP